MKNFDQQLLRLKQALGVTDDQEAAAALGMSKAALSDRKKRDKFPEDKLWALAARRPELRLDPGHILMGDMKDAAMKVTVAQFEAALLLTAKRGGTLAEQLGRAMQIVQEMNQPLFAAENGGPSGPAMQDAGPGVGKHRIGEIDPPTYLPGPTSMAKRHKALLANFDAAPEEGKELIESVAALAAKSSPRGMK